MARGRPSGSLPGVSDTGARDGGQPASSCVAVARASSGLALEEQQLADRRRCEPHIELRLSAGDNLTVEDHAGLPARGVDSSISIRKMPWAISDVLRQQRQELVGRERQRDAALARANRARTGLLRAPPRSPARPALRRFPSLASTCRSTVTRPSSRNCSDSGRRPLRTARGPSRGGPVGRAGHAEELVHLREVEQRHPPQSIGELHRRQRLEPERPPLLGATSARAASAHEAASKTAQSRAPWASACSRSSASDHISRCAPSCIAAAAIDLLVVMDQLRERVFDVAHARLEDPVAFGTRSAAGMSSRSIITRLRTSPVAGCRGIRSRPIGGALLCVSTPPHRRDVFRRVDHAEQTEDAVRCGRYAFRPAPAPGAIGVQAARQRRGCGAASALRTPASSPARSAVRRWPCRTAAPGVSRRMRSMAAPAL